VPSLNVFRLDFKIPSSGRIGLNRLLKRWSLDLHATLHRTSTPPCKNYARASVLLLIYFLDNFSLLASVSISFELCCQMFVSKVYFNPIRIFLAFNFPQAQIFAIHVRNLRDTVRRSAIIPSLKHRVERTQS
jgi:hypothetical protein